MGNEQQFEKLAALFKQTSEVHHEAFAATDGEDPDWAIWYADYLNDRTELRESSLGFSMIVQELKNEL